MVSVKDNLPKIGQKTKCVVNFWRYGEIHHTKEMIAKYIGIGVITNTPMWDIDTGDESFAEVTYWESLD